MMKMKKATSLSLTKEQEDFSSYDEEELEA